MVRKAPRLLALAVVAVWFLSRSAAAQPIGGIDFPSEGQTVSGIVRVSGFVLDFHNLDRVEILVDDVLVNRADTGLPRPDVLEIFPTYYNSATPQPGFLTSFLARGVYSDGPHTISIRVTEASTSSSSSSGPFMSSWTTRSTRRRSATSTRPGPRGSRAPSAPSP